MLKSRYLFAVSFATVIATALVATGVSAQSYPAIGKVIHGTRVSPRNSPFVELRMRDAFPGEYLCSGTFITKKIVLTAAHCVEGGVQQAFILFNGRRYQARKFTIHPNYRENGDTGLLDNDVALLFFSSNFAVTPEPVFLSKGVIVGTTVEFYGYGLDENERTSNLRKGLNTVEEIYIRHFNTLYMGDESNTCNGDSGGPALIRARDSKGRTVRGIAGVISTGTEGQCGAGDFAYFVKMKSASVASFLKKHAPGANFQ